MRVSLLLVVLAALVASVAAQTGCLAACNKGMVACLSACPSQCPADPACMGQCYQTCTKEETECVRQCGRYNALTDAAPAPAAEVQVAAAAASTKPAWVSTPLSESFYQTEFTSFVKRHSKRYSHDEFPLRYDIFKANYNKIRHHNMGKHSYSMAINEFADMTFEEFHTKMTGLNPRQNSYARSLNAAGPHKQIKAVASSLDWRQKGAVTPVKNQQQCGSCWAFSTTGSVEGAHAISSGKLVSLSEQQLVDCSSRYGNQGCNGGLMDQAFEYIIDNKGITTEAAYPYTARDGQCKTGQTAAATLSKYVNVQEGSEADLMAAVNIGPVSIAIEADQQCFQFYSGGILSDPACGTELDHGVLLVGYGTENGKDFWIVKNSWGAGWGEGGYIRLIRGQNECGLASMASYPVV